jgi:hypothetical protein
VASTVRLPLRQPQHFVPDSTAPAKSTPTFPDFASPITRMPDPSSFAFVIAGSLSALAALAHLVCIAVGASAYRVMGAGERMAKAAELHSWEPTLITLAITALLGVWAALAFSAAGWLPRPPMLRLALSAITALYLFRAVAFPGLKRFFPGNSTTFWYVSSGVCFVIGAVHLYGLAGLWHTL